MKCSGKSLVLLSVSTSGPTGPVYNVSVVTLTGDWPIFLCARVADEQVHTCRLTFLSVTGAGAIYFDNVLSLGLVIFFVRQHFQGTLAC